MRVELLTERYQKQIAGVVSCYDRIIVQGTVPKWCYAKVRTALDRAAARLEDKFTAEPLVEASIRLTVGEAYMELGLWEEAQPQIERAVALRRRELGERNRQTLESMYASQQYTEILKQHQAQISMSRKGNPYDNAACESFMKTLKYEEVVCCERLACRGVEARRCFIEDGG